MKHDPRSSTAAEGLGRNLAAARLAGGLSHHDLAQATGIGRRRVRAIERGAVVPTAPELEALSDACGVTPTDLVPPGSNLRLLGGRERGTSTGDPLQGQQAIDALLREYISMVLELRNADRLPAVTLRQEDLTELARALGGSPEAIEARLIELIGTDSEGAHDVRSAILPSVGTP